jgi:hypothetical protein
MHDEIDEYIRANRDRYTREAITGQLLEAGHDRAAVDAAWARAQEGAASRAPIGWRPGWPLLLALVILGAIGTALVWADDTYGAGIAPVIYLILVVIALGLATAIAGLIDRGHGTIAGVLLALVALAGAGMSFGSGLSLVALGIAVLAGAPALLLLAQRGDPHVNGWVAAAIPLVVWLAVTGTCYAPLFGRLLGP